MLNRRSDLLFSTSGLLFLTSFVASAVVGIGPGYEDSLKEVASFASDDRGQTRVAAALMLLSGFFAFVFVAGLHGALFPARAADRRWASLLFAGGTGLASMLLIAPSFALTVVDRDDRSAEIQQTLFDLTGSFVSTAVVAIAAITLAAGMLMLGNARWPGWLAKLGFLAAILGLAGVAGWPFFPIAWLVFTLWIVATSIVMLVRPHATTSDALSAPQVPQVP